MSAVSARLTQRPPFAALRRANPGRWGWAILLAPSVIAVLGGFIAPLVVIFLYSFYRFVPGQAVKPAFISANYHHLLSSYYLDVLLKTMAMGLVIVILSLIMGFPIAYTLARSRSRLKGLLVAAVLVPLMTGVVVRSFGWEILLSNNGVVPKLMGWLHIPQSQLLFTYRGTVIALTEVLLPYMILSLSAVIEQIPRELEEAARNLGAGRWRVFADVIWPLSLPGAMGGSVLVFVQAISAFATPALIGGSSTVVVASIVYTDATVELNWPLASAISTVFVLIVLCFTAAQGRLLQASSVRARQA